MNTYRVELRALAHVCQVQKVKAKNIEQAKALALNHTDDEEWQYLGIDDDTIEATLVFRVREGD